MSRRLAIGALLLGLAAATPASALLVTKPPPTTTEPAAPPPPVRFVLAGGVGSPDLMVAVASLRLLGVFELGVGGGLIGRVPLVLGRVGIRVPISTWAVGVDATHRTLFGERWLPLPGVAAFFEFQGPEDMGTVRLRGGVARPYLLDSGPLGAELGEWIPDIGVQYVHVF